LAQSSTLADPQAFLSEALDPPSPEAVDAALDRLTQLGALDDSGELTRLGSRLAELPMDPGCE